MARILVIDDDPTVRGLTVQILQGHGHAVDQAEDGEAGLVAFRASRPDLVITDMAMPKMDGVEVIATLSKEFPNLPIIAMSGVPDSAQYLYLASYLGAGRMLTKPFVPATLMAAVAGAIGRSKRRGEIEE